MSLLMSACKKFNIALDYPMRWPASLLKKWMLPLWLCSINSIAMAGVPIFSTFGPNDSFGDNGWQLVNAPYSPDVVSYQIIGVRFSPPGSSGQSFNLESVDAAIYHWAVLDTPPYGHYPTSDELGLTVYLELSYDNHGLPGSLIASASTTVMDSKIYKFDFDHSTILASGDTYWLTATPAFGTNLGLWSWNDQGITGFGSSGTPGGFTYYKANPDYFAATPAFRVNVLDAIPEPSPTILMLAGLMFLVANLTHHQTKRTVKLIQR